jgi:molecular chaperone DnaK (HSP70)
VTVPSSFIHDNAILPVYESAFVDCCDRIPPNDYAVLVSFVPEPVATVWGAAHHNLIATSSLSKDDAAAVAYGVVDVGGYTTQVAVVQNDRVRYAATVPWGGEHIVEQCVHVLKQQAASGEVPSFIQHQLNDSRSLVLLQYHARHAVMELSTQTRVAVHVPYIFANPSRHHLDTHVARSVLNQAVEDRVRDLVQERSSGNDITETGWTDHVLSPHLPTPTNLTSLWTSVFTHVLEQSQQLPTNIAAVLVVGGGAKSVLVQQTIQNAWTMLTGGAPTSHNIFKMDAPVQSELTVVGAATLPPSFDYSLSDGLIRHRLR